MNKLKTFWYVFVNTFTNPGYYGDVIKVPFGFSMKFFLSYFFLFSIVATAIVSSVMVPTLTKMLDNLPAKAAEAYPDELAITIKDGQASSNVPEPYFVPFERMERVLGPHKGKFEKYDEIDNFLVIDTKATSEEFTKYRTAVLLTRKNIIAMDDRRGLRITPLKDVGDVVINETLVNNLVQRLTPFLAFIVPSLLLIVFIGVYIFFTTGKLMYLIFAAFFLWILSKFMSYPMTYGKAYQMGLHMIVVVGTFFALLKVFGIETFPFAQMGTFLLMGAIIFFQIKDKKPASKAS